MAGLAVELQKFQTGEQLRRTADRIGEGRVAAQNRRFRLTAGRHVAERVMIGAERRTRADRRPTPGGDPAGRDGEDVVA